MLVSIFPVDVLIVLTIYLPLVLSHQKQAECYLSPEEHPQRHSAALLSLSFKVTFRKRRRKLKAILLGSLGLQSRRLARERCKRRSR